MPETVRGSLGRRIDWSVASFLMLVGAGGLLWAPDGAAVWWLRCGVLLGAGLVAWRARQEGKHRLFLTPLFLTGVLVLVGYSMAPAVYLEIYEWVFLPAFPEGHGVAHQQATAYVGSTAERLVLSFAALALAAAAALLTLAPGRSSEKKLGRTPPKWLWPAVMLSLLLSGARAVMSVQGISVPSEGIVSRLAQDALDGTVRRYR